MCSGKLFSLNDYYTTYPSFTPLAEHLKEVGIGRGLPSDQDIQDNADVFRRILENGTLAPDRKGQLKEALERCHSRGWIQSEIADDFYERIHYIFPSPLHIAYMSWYRPPSSEPILFDSLYDLALEVIACFKPSQLTNMKRKIGGGLEDRAPGAQYTFEFYHGLFQCCSGNVRITPEFASGTNTGCAGRIDFLIPVKKWGVECTQDGDRLAAHSERFDQDTGAYRAWLESNKMEDYILLDFRQTMPVGRYSSV
jgi:hypothetical protein